MAVNLNDALEIAEDGLAFTNNDGQASFYLTSGTGDPTGLSAPVNTWYFRTDNNLLYYKFGIGLNDWRQIRGLDIASIAAANTPPGATVQDRLDNIEAQFVPTPNVTSGTPPGSNVEDRLNNIEAQFVPTPNVTSGTPPGGNVEDRLNNIEAQFVPYDPSSSDELSDTDLQAAVQTLANRNFGKNYDFARLATFTTNATGFQSALSITGTFPAGDYRIAWGFSSTNSKNNTDNETRVVFDGTEEYLLETERADFIKSGNGFINDLIFSGGALTVAIETRRSSGNGSVLLSDLFLEVWRVS